MLIPLGKPIELNGRSYAELNVREDVLAGDLMATGDAPNEVAQQPSWWSRKHGDTIARLAMGNEDGASATGESAPSSPTSSPA